MPAKPRSTKPAGTSPLARPGHEHWTEPQWEAIVEDRRSLLVSAAAGSGKTAVLARRCVHLVCDADNPCDVDELLVVTFTEKAAAEMRSRITGELRKRIVQCPDDERLRRQLALVDQAQVSTLHAFCARMLREHFHLVGIDPGFKVMDGDEAALLRRDVARELFERRYDDEDGAFQRLIDSYGQGDDDRVLRQLLILHELLTSVADPAAWIADARQRISEGIELPLERSALGKELREVLTSGLTSIQRRCDEAIAGVKRLRIPHHVGDLQEIAAMLGHWRDVLKEHGIDALAEFVSGTQLPKLPSVKNGVPGKERAKELVDGVRDQLKSGAWRNALRFSTTQWKEGLEKVRPHSESFLDLVGQFAERYRRAKREARSVDFADLERLTLDALREQRGEEIIPSPAARTYHRRFAHVLVDEFQDINEVQDKILEMVSRECLATGGSERQAGNLFCVGDVKQSIYRFRLAESQRFLKRLDAFRLEASHGRVIDLQANFRSRLPLLDALNRIFSRLMTRDAADIEYDQTHHLQGGKTYPVAADGRSFHGAPIELHLLPIDLSGPEPEAGPSDESDDGDDLDRTQREAMLISRRILEMTTPGGPKAKLVADEKDPKKLRPMVYSDIVILLRSMKFKAGHFAGMLRQHGIPVHANSTTGFFDSMEVRDVVALLSLMDNQRQDVPLAAVLRGPLGRLGDAGSALARIRAAFPDSAPFHEAAIRYAAEKDDATAGRLKAFFADLSAWRDAAGRRPLADVLWTIYQRTGLLAYVAGLDEGDQRVRNLMYLHERAAQFGAFQSRGLSRFMRFLEQLREESDLGQPSLASEAENVVRIMSIHASKGLEFPIVFIPDLGKRINMQSCQGHILADRAAGLGMSVVDESRRCRYPSLASMLVKRQLAQQSLAEEMRVLYVAMTRAREHLILVGTAGPKSIGVWQSRWADREGPPPTDVILGARTMLDWIGPVMAMTAGDAEPVFEMRFHEPDEVAGWKSPRKLREENRDERAMAMTRLEPVAGPAACEAANRVIAQLSFVYPFAKFSEMPASQSVTKRGHAEATAVAEPARLPASQRLPVRPRFLEPATLTAADRGTITHLVLEHLDFFRACDDADISAQIEEMVGRRVMRPDEAAIVDRSAIAWLLNDPIGGRLRQRTGVRRELPVNFPMTDPDAIPSADPLDQIMVRGRIDVLILSDDQTAMLLDYKTDALTAAEVPARAEIYRPQLQAYREAITSITGRKINDIYLAFLTPRVMYRL